MNRAFRSSSHDTCRETNLRCPPPGHKVSEERTVPRGADALCRRRSSGEREEGGMGAAKLLSRTAAITLAVFCAVSVPCQGSWSQGAWSQTPVTGTVPNVVSHAAVYDLTRQRLIAFGGFDPGFAVQASTTLFDGVHWSQVATATVAPPARAGHAMVYDITRDRVVLFGGLASLLSPPLGDTWEFDGVTWTQRFPAHAPQRRVDHAMAYDVASQGALLFGGRTGQAVSHGDTWVWDGTDWAQVAVTGPSPRHGHAMSCDWNRGRTVMFGGFAAGAVGDTWEWNGSSWSHVLTGPAPSARSSHGMAFDFESGITVLHGGTQNGAETWEWDGAEWTQHGSTNLGTTNHVLVYDARLRRTTSFGGQEPGSFVFRSEIETYGFSVPGSYETRGTSCAGSAGTPQLIGVSALASGPTIGETAIVQLRQTWFHAFFVFGWSDTDDGGTPLPFDLGAFGMPGCSLQVSRDAIASAFPVNGTATMLMPVPNNPFLVGQSYFIQGLSLDLAANAGGYTTTNRILATVGRN